MIECEDQTITKSISALASPFFMQRHPLRQTNKPKKDIILDLILVNASLRSHLTNMALSELTDKPCGRVTSGIQEPQLTPGLQKDTQLQKTSNVKYGGTCKEKGCGLHGITIPGAAAAPKGTSLPLGKQIG